MQAIVFNGHYLNYFDVAFTEYWRGTGLPDVLAQAAANLEMFARKATIEYHAPARFDDVLEIGVRCAELGRSSLRFVIEIYHGEALLILGEMLYVHADSLVRKSEPVPETWRAALCAFEHGLAVKT